MDVNLWELDSTSTISDPFKPLIKIQQSIYIIFIKVIFMIAYNIERIANYNYILLLFTQYNEKERVTFLSFYPKQGKNVTRTHCGALH